MQGPGDNEAIPFSFSQADDAYLYPVRGGEQMGFPTIGDRYILAKGWVKNIGQQPREMALGCQVSELGHSKV